MKISFVIPAYNEQHYIGACVESILQACRTHDFEIIVVNNASTDQTRSTALKYPNVRVIDEPVKGTNQARNTGFAHATGDLIANIDADNRIHHGWLKKTLAEFAGNPELVALSGPYVFYDLSDNWHWLVRTFYRIAYPIYVLNNKFLHRGGAVMGGNVVIRSGALKQVGGYNTSLRFYGDDTDTAMRLNKIGLVKFDYRFTIFSSGRRLQKQGAAAALFLYAVNHLWTAVFKRPFTPAYEEVRVSAK